MESLKIEDLVHSISESIQKEDIKQFMKCYYNIANLCRKVILETDTSSLMLFYNNLSSLLSNYFRSGISLWPKVERWMGGIEALVDLMGNQSDIIIYTKGMSQIADSKVDKNILTTLYYNSPGINSGELSKRCQISQNHLTNRLLKLEKAALLSRAKRGRNSLIFLTPRGRAIISDILDSEASELSVLEAVHDDEDNFDQFIVEAFQFINNALEEYPTMGPSGAILINRRNLLGILGRTNKQYYLTDASIESQLIKYCKSQFREKSPIVTDGQSKKLVGWTRLATN